MIWEKLLRCPTLLRSYYSLSSERSLLSASSIPLQCQNRRICCHSYISVGSGTFNTFLKGVDYCMAEGKRFPPSNHLDLFALNILMLTIEPLVSFVMIRKTSEKTNTQQKTFPLLLHFLTNKTQHGGIYSLNQYHVIRLGSIFFSPNMATRQKKNS